jgi:hypothetical protein
MDLFTFYPPSGLLLYKPCGYGVPPSPLNTHIRFYHLDDARNAATNPRAPSRSRKPAKLLANYLRERYHLDPATARIPVCAMEGESSTPPISMKSPVLQEFKEEGTPVLYR